jgi:hypothetical protein
MIIFKPAGYSNRIAVIKNSNYNLAISNYHVLACSKITKQQAYNSYIKSQPL